MPVQIKDKYLGAKVTTQMFKAVVAYTRADGDMTQGDLMRNAVSEFLINHPKPVKEGKK